MISAIKFVYENQEDLSTFNSIVEKAQLDQNVKIESYCETKTGERKKAIVLKSQWGTKISPLIVVYNNDNKAIKVFYREQGDNLSAFENFLIHPKKIDDSVFKEFVKKCKDYNLSLTDVVEKLNSLYYEAYN